MCASSLPWSSFSLTAVVLLMIKTVPEVGTQNIGCADGSPFEKLKATGLQKTCTPNTPGSLSAVLNAGCSAGYSCRASNISTGLNICCQMKGAAGMQAQCPGQMAPYFQKGDNYPRKCTGNATACRDPFVCTSSGNVDTEMVCCRNMTWFEVERYQ